MTRPATSRCSSTTARSCTSGSKSQYWESHLRRLIEEHAEETQSRFARRLLNDWMLERGKFWQIAPKEMLDKLTQPLSDARVANLAE